MGIYESINSTRVNMGVLVNTDAYGSCQMLFLAKGYKINRIELGALAIIIFGARYLELFFILRESRYDCNNLN